MKKEIDLNNKLEDFERLKKILIEKHNKNLIDEKDLEKAELLYKQSNDSGNAIGKFLFENGKDKRGTGIMNAQGDRHSLLKEMKKKKKKIYIIGYNTL